MPQDFTDDKLIMVQVMAWCRQATSHYLGQCWPRSISAYGVARPQWVKGKQTVKTWNISRRLTPQIMKAGCWFLSIFKGGRNGLTHRGLVIRLCVSQSTWSALFLDRGGGGTPSLRVSRYALRFCFCPPFSASGQSFCLPKIWPCLPFYSDLVGSHFKSLPFSVCRWTFCPPNWVNLSFYSDLVGSHFELWAAHPY